ncbi:MAG: hypothetical protein GY765_19680, partial [bacterium]|nr:hypothetical protein [bacterium]
HGHLSPGIQWLRDYYFKGLKRNWNNEYTSWTTGTPWDSQFDEFSYYIVPETYAFLQTFRSSFRQNARQVKLPEAFFKKSLVERRAWFLKEVMVNYLPAEIMPGDLIAGGRFNVQTSNCFTRREAKKYNHLIYGKNGSRETLKRFHRQGYGNCGAVSGHLTPDYKRIIRCGWQDINRELLDI